MAARKICILIAAAAAIAAVCVVQAHGHGHGHEHHDHEGHGHSHGHGDHDHGHAAAGHEHEDVFQYGHLGEADLPGYEHCHDDGHCHFVPCEPGTDDPLCYGDIDVTGFPKIVVEPVVPRAPPVTIGVAADGTLLQNTQTFSTLAASTQSETTSTANAAASNSAPPASSKTGSAPTSADKHVLEQLLQEVVCPQPVVNATRDCTCNCQVTLPTGTATTASHTPAASSSGGSSGTPAAGIHVSHSYPHIVEATAALNWWMGAVTQAWRTSPNLLHFVDQVWHIQWVVGLVLWGLAVVSIGWLIAHFVLVVMSMFGGPGGAAGPVQLAPAGAQLEIISTQSLPTGTFVHVVRMVGDTRTFVIAESSSNHVSVSQLGSSHHKRRAPRRVDVDGPAVAGDGGHAELHADMHVSTPERTPASPQSAFGASQWKPATDARGRTYYYNPITGATSWERPTE